MSVTSTTSRVSYSGNGVTVNFAISFYFQKKADIFVVLYDTATGVSTTQALTTNYTISAETDPDFHWPNGGTLTMLVAPPTGTNITIYRDPAAKQELQIPQSGPFPSKPIESQLDLLTQVVQRSSDIASRSAVLDDGFAGAFDPTLPNPTADTSIVFNPTATGFAVGPTVTQIAAAAAAAASASVYSYYGAAGGTGNALTLTPSTALSAYSTGIHIIFIASATNSGAATINISGLGVKSLKSQSGATLLAGEITSGRIYSITYNGTDFIVHEVQADASIDAAKIAADAVTTAKVLNANITLDKLAVGAAGKWTVTATKTGTYTAAAGELVICSASGGGFTVNFPAAANNNGQLIRVKRIDQTLANAVTVDFNSSETGDGATTKLLMTQYEEYCFACDGTGWHIVDHLIPSVWTSYSPTIGATTTPPTEGTGVTKSYHWRREGDSMRIRAAYIQTGAGSAGSGAYLFPLPSGVTSKSAGATVSTAFGGGGGNVIGYGFITNDPATAGGATTYLFRLNMRDTSNMIAHNQETATTASNPFGSGSLPFSNGKLSFSFDVLVPITNWEG